jgi:hypothetical protein
MHGGAENPLFGRFGSHQRMKGVGTGYTVTETDA